MRLQREIVGAAQPLYCFMVLRPFVWARIKCWRSAAELQHLRHLGALTPSEPHSARLCRVLGNAELRQTPIINVAGVVVCPQNPALPHSYEALTKFSLWFLVYYLVDLRCQCCFNVTRMWRFGYQSNVYVVPLGALIVAPNVIKYRCDENSIRRSLLQMGVYLQTSWIPTCSPRSLVNLSSPCRH